MTPEQKEEHLKFLYHQLDVCGQILAEWDDEHSDIEYRREYRKILNEIVKLEPEKWKDFPVFQKKDYTKRNIAVAEYCKTHPCPECGGERKQNRSGSYRVVCTKCGKKYQLSHN